MGGTAYSDGWGKIDETPDPDVEINEVETNKLSDEVSDVKPSPENEITE